MATAITQPASGASCPASTEDVNHRQALLVGGTSRAPAKAAWIGEDTKVMGIRVTRTSSW
jgi:hypothetical protein